MTTERPLTPMMERYLEVKGQNPEAILFFRMGDFYELFYTDAQVAAKVLGLTLTSRDKGSTNPVPMAGFPYHALDGYLQKMIRAGHRVAICEQVEDPKQAKGMVKREVTRVVTPGTLIEDSLLDPRESNFLAALVVKGNDCGLAWVEVSSGRFIAGEFSVEQGIDELARIRPAEVLVPQGFKHDSTINGLRQLRGPVLTERPHWAFGLDASLTALKKQFQVATLAGFGIDETSRGIMAAGAVLDYLQETQRSELGHLTRLEPFERGAQLLIDEASRRSLELTRTLRGDSRDGSLLAVMDETATPMGARLLAEWLSNPLTDIAAIEARQAAIAELVSTPLLLGQIKDALGQAYDLQRLTARVATGRASPRDLVCLARTLALLPKLKAQLAGRQANRLKRLEAMLDLCPEIRSLVEGALVDEPPLLTSDGGMIRPGYHGQLDEWRDLARGGKEWIARYQAQEVQRTGIPNLKVGFNRVFGYYLECTAAQAEKVPADYIRKQTLKNQERFITPELKQYEDKVLRAEGQAIALEQELFAAIRLQVARESQRLRSTAEVIAEVDVLVGLATLAIAGRYCRPTITSDPVLVIREGRHPVLDRLRPSGEFVPNDIRLGNEHGRLQLITGPNMAGKSTYIRQSALLVIMAQMGSFVPAAEATIGVADRIFARVGASDELSRGQSTFMVEMTETARILNGASQHSLVILDEIGRGTSTYDGISLAWAITEFLHDIVCCRTLFATHYHELTQLTQSLPEARNWNVVVREQAEEIVFLHKILEGAADKSYGIHVGRLAGLPQVVLERAKTVLATLENDHTDDAGKTKIPARKTTRRREFQLPLFEAPEHPVLDDLRKLNVEELTPIAALQALQRFRDQIK
jgi:DNA mismatch repair protein MutS